MQPQTSLEAYSNKIPTIKTDHNKILYVMEKGKDYTYKELAYLLKWSNPVRVARRLSEMVKQNKITSLKQRKCTIAGSNCNSYLKL